MASEYLKWKARDERPEEPPPELNGWEKLKNWLYYYKWWLLAGVLFLWAVAGILWGALGIGQLRPDIIVAYVGGPALPETEAEEIRAALTSLCPDINGDGEVMVELRQYALDPQGDPETVMYYAQAAATSLVADMEKGESAFFITADPESLQNSFEILAESRKLSDILGIESELYIGPRVYYGEMAQGKEAEAELWETMKGKLGIRN